METFYRKFFDAGWRISLISALTAACAGASRPTSNSTEIPTGVVVAESATPPPLEITQFALQTISDREIGVNFCTVGRPVGTTIRISYYPEVRPDPNFNLDQIDSSKWEIIKELGVPCFNTNLDNPDWPILITDNLEDGYYLFRAQARPSEAAGDWSNESVVSQTTAFKIDAP